MAVDVMRPVFHSEPKCRVTLLTIEEWIQRTWDSPCSQRSPLVYRWVQDAGGSQGQRLWAIFGKETEYLFRKICCSVPG